MMVVDDPLVGVVVDVDVVVGVVVDVVVGVVVVVGAGAVVTGTVGAWVVEGASGSPAMVVVEVGEPISGPASVVLGVSVTIVVVVVESSETGPGSLGSAAEVAGERRTVVAGVVSVVSVVSSMGAAVVAVVLDAIGPSGWSTISDVVEADMGSWIWPARTSTSGTVGGESWEAMSRPSRTMIVPMPPVIIGSTRRRSPSSATASR